MGNSSEIIHLKPESDLDPEPKKVSEPGGHKANPK